MQFRGYSWTAAFRRHGVTRDQVRHVVVHCGVVYVRPAAPPGRPDEALLFVGDDVDGTPIEVVGVVLDDARLRIIHAMPMRQAYLALYQEAARWRL